MESLAKRRPGAFLPVMAGVVVAVVAVAGSLAVAAQQGIS